MADTEITKTPTLRFAATDANFTQFSDHDGPLVVYFYPKDNTPGCTSESKDFRDLYPEFQKLGTEVVGVSRDSLASHEKFKTKLELPFALISDESSALCHAFGVVGEKSMFGKTFLGLKRSTFLFDGKGKLIKAWRNVKVKGHAQAVLNALKTHLTKGYVP